MLWTSARLSLLFFLSYFFLPEWMQGNLKDIPSNLLSCQCETLNILLCRKKEDCRCKTVHLFNFLLPTKGKLTQVETWKMRTKSMSESVLAALVNALYTPAVPAASHRQQRLCFPKSEPRGQDICMRAWLPTQTHNAVRNTAGPHCGLPFGSCPSVAGIHSHNLSLEQQSPSCLLQERLWSLDFMVCFGKCQLLAPKGLIWRASLMKEKDEVCIHVPSQWEMFGLGDMSMYRKIKARGVLFCCFPWWLDSVMNVPW